LRAVTSTSIAENLRRRTFNYALEIIKYCHALPNEWDTREIGSQLLRAGTGAAGNYWSACRGRSDREFISRLGVAEDESAESVLWLMLIDQSGIRSDEKTKAMLQEGREITAILSKSRKTAKENRRNRKNKNRSTAALP